MPKAYAIMHMHKHYHNYFKHINNLGPNTTQEKLLNDLKKDRSFLPLLWLKRKIQLDYVLEEFHCNFQNIKNVMVLY